jgi:trk system potassium uptake protein TrkH
MRSALLANLGFVLQISGIFVLVPIIVSFIYPNETSATIGLFITACVFLVLGFILNSLCEKKALSFKQSCTLVVIVFIILSLIGSIPYLYVTLQDTSVPLAQHITDSIFESTSGFTTTGFSVISDLSALPKSIILYRGLTQFIGGIGIVLIMLAFFYPEAKLKEFSRSMGFGNNGKVKKTFMIIISVYCTYTVIMIVSGFLLGYSDPVNLAAFIFAALSTGGFAPIADITTAVTQPPLNFIIPFSMILGAVNFILLAGLIKRKFKEFLRSEAMVFLVMMVFAIAIAAVAFNLTPFDATFHIISAMSTAGFSYLPIQNSADTFKLFLILLMFIGGTSLSTAGGIKIIRLLVLVKAIKKSTVDTITQKESKLTLFGKEYSNHDIIHAGTYVLLIGAITFVSSLIVTAFGFSPINAAFETTSALAATGLSVGIVGPTLAMPLKWLFMVLMVIGRVEIISILVIFSRTKEPAQKCKKVAQKNQTSEPSEDSEELDSNTDEVTVSNEEQQIITKSRSIQRSKRPINTVQPLKKPTDSTPL